MVLLPSPSEKSSNKETICYKHVINIETSKIIELEKYIDHISTLKLEFCNVSAPQIETLASLLTGNATIMEVSVNGNPNDEQNFHLLLHGTKIINLSLKFCCINYNGIEKISDELYTVSDSSLLHLNLSSNSIRNSSVRYIARFLRINRTLISLNLANNQIYDRGCLELIDSLQKFQLNFEELVLRRRMRFQMQRRRMSREILLQETASKIKSLSKLKVSSLSTNKPFSEFTIPTIDHPFMWDDSDESQGVYCKGNDALINLNLCYNRITVQGLTGLVSMLDYQISNYAYDKGISRISTEGNDFDDYDQATYKLRELLASRNKKSIGVTSSKQKASRKRS